MSFSEDVKNEIRQKSAQKSKGKPRKGDAAKGFLRDCFLKYGSMSNPEKGYHLEFACESEEDAQRIIAALSEFGIDAKTVVRKRYKVVYIKESEDIVELLNVLGAHVCLMNMENVRILKDMRNSINRQVNCETANISKTVNAAAKQLDDIRYVEAHYGLGNLDEKLKVAAEARLKYPDATLAELGASLEPPVGKSGMNHRLRRICEIADNLRTKH